MTFEVGDFVQPKTHRISPGVILTIVPLGKQLERSVRIQVLNPGSDDPTLYWSLESELEYAALEELAAVLDKK